MEAENKSFVSRHGMLLVAGALDLVTLIFVTLKIMDAVSWSWAVVMMPFWIPLLCVALTFIVFVTFRNDKADTE